VLRQCLNPKETTLAPSKAKTADAHAQFKKLQHAADGKKAMAEYEAEGIATRAKTEKLRALRLARDAELGKADAAAAAAAGGKPAKKPAKVKRKSVTLSDYQRDIDDSGRGR
jgi:hypothetical protein